MTKIFVSWASHGKNISGDERNRQRDAVIAMVRQLFAGNEEPVLYGDWMCPGNATIKWISDTIYECDKVLFLRNEDAIAKSKFARDRNTPYGWAKDKAPARGNGELIHMSDFVYGPPVTMRWILGVLSGGYSEVSLGSSEYGNLLSRLEKIQHDYDPSGTELEMLCQYGWKKPWGVIWGKMDFVTGEYDVNVSESTTRTLIWHNYDSIVTDGSMQLTKLVGKVPVGVVNPSAATLKLH